jgi:hypothetical protein
LSPESEVEYLTGTAEVIEFDKIIKRIQTNRTNKHSAVKNKKREEKQTFTCWPFPLGRYPGGPEKKKKDTTYRAGRF